MDPIEQVLDKLAAEVGKVSAEIETAIEEGAALEDMERAKALAADFLEKYNGLIKKLRPVDIEEIENRIGVEVEEIKKYLTLLKEAPE